MAMNYVNLMAIAGENLKVLKEAREGGRLPYASLHHNSQQIVIIGLNHAPEINKIVLDGTYRGASFGSILVVRGEGKSGNRGKLTVNNFRGNAAEKKLFIAEIRKVSDKTVEFV